MRQKSLFAGVVILLVFLLRFPAEALSASRNGMSLWLNTLLPTLLPFLILTGILLHTDGIERLLRPFARTFRVLFGLTAAGAYVFLLGMLCGYPMGAKLSADLYANGKLSRREAEYLLTFASNPSPAFVLGYLGNACLNGQVPGAEIIAVFVLSSLLCMLFFRFLVYHNRTYDNLSEIRLKKETSQDSQGAIVDASIMNGFETITRLGGYILLFSLLSALISHYWQSFATAKLLLLGITEITTGVHLLAQAGLPFQTLYLYAMMLTSFGGLCILAQTKSVLGGKLSILPYFASKCLCALCTALLVVLFRLVL